MRALAPQRRWQSQGAGCVPAEALTAVAAAAQCFGRLRVPLQACFECLLAGSRSWT